MLKSRKLDRHNNGGLNFTELGFGTAPLGNLYKSISDEEAQKTLDEAWASGLRYFDTAPLYGLGLSETRLNKFLRNRNISFNVSNFDVLNWTYNRCNY